MATVRLNEGHKGSRACHLWSIVTPRKSASGSGVGTRPVREWPLEDGRMFGRDLVPTARSHPAAARVRVDVGRVGPRRAEFGGAWSTALSWTVHRRSRPAGSTPVLPRQPRLHATHASIDTWLEKVSWAPGCGRSRREIDRVPSGHEERWTKEESAVIDAPLGYCRRPRSLAASPLLGRGAERPLPAHRLGSRWRSRSWPRRFLGGIRGWHRPNRPAPGSDG